MSYSRFGTACEVYTFHNCDGYFECCGCIMPGKRQTWFKDARELAAHLREHQALGHEVPEHVIASILEDA